MTKKENFNAIRNYLNAQGNADFNEFIDNEIAHLEKRSSYRSTKPTKRQMENEVVKEHIINALAASNDGMTCTQIINEIGDSSLSVARISALLKQLDDKVRNEKKGKKSLYFLA